MAARFVFAVAADREICVMRKSCEKIEKPRGVGLVHLGAEFALKDFPRAIIVARVLSE